MKRVCVLSVVAEGARPLGGGTLAVEPSRPGHVPRLGGAGARLLGELEGAGLNHELRLTVLGHLQRGGSPTALDRILGTELGTYAAELCHADQVDRRIVIREGKVRSIPLTREPEAALHKHLDAQGPIARSARLVGIELGAPVDDRLGKVSAPLRASFGVHAPPRPAPCAVSA